jgi:hypothetical protein
MSSITNQIVANIKKTSTNFNSYSFINSENVVCIDTSNNRIGINQKKPTYSIDICGTSTSNAIRVHDLYINNLATIEEISCNKLSVGYFTSKILDVSNMNFEVLYGNKLDLSYLIIHDISTASISVPSISVDFIDVSDNINTYSLNVTNEIITNKLTAQTVFSAVADFTNMNIDNSANIKICNIEDLSCDYITGGEISCNNIYVTNGLYALNDTSFNNLHVDGDVSANNLYIENSADISFLSANNIEFNFMTGNIFNATTIKSNGVTLINNGTLGDPIAPTNGIFLDLRVTNLDVSNYLINTGTTDLSAGKLILPEYLPAYESGTFEPGTISFDKTTNILKVFNTVPVSKWNNILFKLNFATMSLRKDISGNYISYDSVREQYVIDDSNNLILDKNVDPNVKYIPIVYDVSSGDKFDISNNGKTIEINDPVLDELYEIHASIGIKYLNNNPGDVEPNVYTVGIYPNMNTFNNIRDSIDSSFVIMNSAIVAFDNSYNYANVSLNYIGPLANTRLGHTLSDRSGFNFYISSTKDINFLVVDQFNATIKQLQTF